MCRLQMAILAVPMIKTQMEKDNSSGACFVVDEEMMSDRRKRSVLQFDPYGDQWMNRMADEVEHTG